MAQHGFGPTPTDSSGPDTPFRATASLAGTTHSSKDGHGPIAGLAAVGGHAKSHILLVDDEPNLRMALAIMLRHSGYDVTTAANGAEALACLHSDGHRCDLVLLDVGLPDIGGCEVCRQVRLEPATQNLPVIMISGHCRDIDMEKGISAGANFYETKPVRMQPLLERIASLIDASEAAHV